MLDLTQTAAQLSAARQLQMKQAGLRLDGTGSEDAVRRYLEGRQNQIGLAMGMAGFRLDAGEAALLDRELRFVETQVFRREYPALKHRTLLPQNTSIPRGAGSVSYRMLEQVRAAKIVSGTSNDIPRADVFASEWPTPLRPIASSFVYNVLELAQAAMTGVPIDAERAISCRDSIEALLNQLAFFGDAPFGLPGFFNNSNVSVVAAVSDGTQTVWNNSGTIKSSAGIIADVEIAIRAVISGTAGIIRPNAIAFPVSLMNVLRRPLSITGGSDATLLSYFQKNYPEYTFEDVTELETANAAGTGPRIVVYAKDETVVDELIAGEYEQLPPQPQGLGFLNIGWAVTGGTRIRKPKAVVYLDGAG